MFALPNARHERFAQGLAEGKTQAQAYIDAGFSPKNARANASALLKKNPRILERRDQMLRTREECNFAAVAEIAVESHCTLESHLAKLAELRDEAQAKGDYASAISAEYKRGQALGFYIQRKEHGKPGQFTARSREEAEKQLEEVIAKIAAKQAIQKAQAGPGGV
jgi:phage terminase small subunit